MNICYVVCIWIFLTEIQVSSTDEIKTRGYSGQNATVSCHHGWASTNRKYFCKDPCNDKDVLVSSNQSPNGRFGLKDFKNGLFIVTITDLQESDTGLYWCGVDRTAWDTYHKVKLIVLKEVYTNKDITPIPTKSDTIQTPTLTTRQPESLYATSTSRCSTPDDITSSPSVTVSVKISSYAVGGLIAVIIFFVVLVAVHRCRKRVKSSTGNLPVTSVNKQNERTDEEANNVYENDLQAAQNSKEIKSKKLKPKVPKSNEHSVYLNLEYNTGQSDIIYGNLDPSISPEDSDQRTGPKRPK